MMPQELKNSIIQLAMQGRLVDQIENEGTGDDLLHQITRARRQLGIRDNKKVEPITEDILPFDIPSSWCWARFGDIVTYNMGKTPPRAETQWWENDFPWVSIADMPENGHITSTKESVSRQAIVERFGNRFSPAGTMIMSFKLTVGRVSILDIDAVHNEAIISIFPLCDSDNCLKQYLFHLLPTITQYGDSKNAIKGKTLNDTSISNLLIPLPPFAEQKRIVAKIEELLPLIERYEKAWSRLEDFNKRFPVDMQKSILQMAIQGRLVEQCPEEGTGEELYRKIQAEKQALIKAGKIKKEKPLPEITEDEIPFEIPESWKWCRLYDLCSLIGDIDHNMPKAVSPEEGVLFLSAKDLIDDGTINYTRDVKYISEDDFIRLSRKALPRRNDIIYSRIGAALGKARVVESDIRFLVSYSCCTIRPIDVDAYYLRYYLESPLILQHSYDARQSTGVPDLGMGEIKKYIVALPPLAEQKRIVAQLEELLPLCERLK